MNNNQKRKAALSIVAASKEVNNKTAARIAATCQYIKDSDPYGMRMTEMNKKIHEQIRNKSKLILLDHISDEFNSDYVTNKMLTNTTNSKLNMSKPKLHKIYKKYFENKIQQNNKIKIGDVVYYNPNNPRNHVNAGLFIVSYNKRSRKKVLVNYDEYRRKLVSKKREIILPKWLHVEITSRLNFFDDVIQNLNDIIMQNIQFNVLN